MAGSELWENPRRGRAQPALAMNDRVITGQNWRVNRFPSSPASDGRRRVATASVSHPDTGSPRRGPGRGRIRCYTRVQEFPPFPFWELCGPFELKTYGSFRAESPDLQAISSKGRFRKTRPDFPFGKRMPGPVPASGSGRLPSVNAAAAPLPDDMPDPASLHAGHTPGPLPRFRKRSARWSCSVSSPPPSSPAKTASFGSQAISTGPNSQGRNNPYGQSA